MERDETIRANHALEVQEIYETWRRENLERNSDLIKYFINELAGDYKHLLLYNAKLQDCINRILSNVSRLSDELPDIDRSYTKLNLISESKRCESELIEFNSNVDRFIAQIMTDLQHYKTIDKEK